MQIASKGMSMFDVIPTVLMITYCMMWMCKEKLCDTYVVSFLFHSLMDQCMPKGP